MLEGDRNEDNPADNPKREPAIEGDGSSDKLPPTPAPPEPPPTPPSTEASENSAHERRENAKLILEVAGVFILCIYTFFTALQWSQIRWTNRLTREALDGNNYALGQTLDKMGAQVAQAGRQADNIQTLADRMKDQADQTKIIAAQAKVSADAATSAAETAKEALHISQRAYLVIGMPSIHKLIPHMELPIDNIGRIASGKVTIIAHEYVATLAANGTPTGTMFNTWGEIDIPRVAPGTGLDNFSIPLPTLDSAKVNNGTQFIQVAGRLSYNDGFPGTKDQMIPFCYRSGAIVTGAPGGDTPTPSTEMQMSKCDPDIVIPEMEQMDEHYAPKYKWPTLPE